MELKYFTNYEKFMSNNELKLLFEIESKMLDDNFEHKTKIVHAMHSILEQIMKRIIINEGAELPYEIYFKLLKEKFEFVFKSKFPNSEFPRDITGGLNYIHQRRNMEEHNPEMVSDLSFSDTVHYLKTFEYIISFFIMNFISEEVERNDIEKFFYKNTKHKPYFLDVITEKNSLTSNSIKLNKVSLMYLVLDPKYRFYIPSYQRGYKWNIDNCTDLLGSVKKRVSLESEDFFGTMAITIEKSSINSEEKTIRLIDGQQRITTSLLIFRAIYDLLRKMVNENLKDNFDDYSDDTIPNELKILFGYKDMKTNNKYENFDTTTKDSKVIEYLTTTKHSIDDIKKYLIQMPDCNAKQNYLGINLWLENFTSYELIDIFETLANKFVFSCIDFDNSKNEEMEIFENINSKGMELSAIDILKNMYFNMVEKELFHEKEKTILEIYSKYFDFDQWNKTPEDKIINNSLFKIANYKLMKSGLKDINLKDNKKSILFTFGELYKKYKNLNIDDFEGMISEDGKYMSIIKTLYNESYITDSNDSFYDLRFEINNIAHKEFTIYILFFIVDKIEPKSWRRSTKTFVFNNKIIIKEILFEFEKWVVSLTTGVSPNKAILNMLKSISKEIDWTQPNAKQGVPRLAAQKLSGIIDEAAAGENSTPTKNMFIESIGINPIQDKHIKRILIRRLEHHLIHNWKFVKKNEEIEHIMPGTILNSIWMKDLSIDGELSYDLIIENHKKYKEFLGNLLLVDKVTNIQLSNHPFDIKKTIYIEKELKLVNKKLNQEQSLIETKHFNFEEIKNRSKSMAEYLANEIYYKE